MIIVRAFSVIKERIKEIVKGLKLNYSALVAYLPAER